MKIKEIRHLSVPVTGNIANAVVNFSEHTISLVAVITDEVRNGRPVTGIAFDSIGRFAQGGIIEQRMVPRLMAAKPESLLAADGAFDCARVYACIMRNEKPGGHGDRAAACGALELAFWDLNAKLRDEPAYLTISRAFGTTPVTSGQPVYAAGGYYYPQDGVERLKQEIRRYKDMGYSAYKMKIGGASLSEDTARIEAALQVAESGANLAVDVNGRFDLEQAQVYAKAISPYKLRWYEEIGDPLDYELNRVMAETYDGPIATGENLFSTQDARNLLRYGGMRKNKDIFQMDPGLSYGLTEFSRMITLVEQAGINRKFIYPHGGHLINLHISTALDLGGCEAYPGVFEPFGGYSDECKVIDGRIHPGSSPGFGIERKNELKPHIARLLA
ncbi:MAG: mandelate racemase [Methylobacteriaceae bacterium]|jgi:L-alanine-DL-glutamate epimerase-like enolase superfamily enzyme|nr:mandelate racemase [Methylobacteriaceae bacterium]